MSRYPSKKPQHMPASAAAENVVATIEPSRLATKKSKALTTRGPATVIINHTIIVFANSGDVNMATNENNFHGPTIIGNHVEGNTQTQLITTQIIEWDEALRELPLIRAKLKEIAKDKGKDLDCEIGEIASAEKAAREKDPSKLISCLKGAGKVAWEAAKSVGAEVIAKLIGAQLGLG